MSRKTGAWQGGAANRTWQRDRRSATDGRIGLAADVHRILEAFHASHGWQPGATWNPHTGTYELPEGQP